MSVLIFSDTHGDVQGMASLVSRHNPEMVLHLGDCTRDAERLAALFPGLTIRHVRGNCDYSGGGAPEFFVAEWRGHKLYLTHGHRHGIHYGLQHLADCAAACHCEAAFYGHTHTAWRETVRGILLGCPGSLTRPRDGRYAYGVLEEYDGALDFMIREDQ